MASSESLPCLENESSNKLGWVGGTTFGRQLKDRAGLLEKSRDAAEERMVDASSELQSSLQKISKLKEEVDRLSNLIGVEGGEVVAGLQQEIAAGDAGFTLVFQSYPSTGSSVTLRNNKISELLPSYVKKNILSLSKIRTNSVKQHCPSSRYLWDSNLDARDAASVGRGGQVN